MTAARSTEYASPPFDAALLTQIEIDPRLLKYAPIMPPDEFMALAAWVSSFYDFQRDWLLDESKFAICNKSRQIGISHTSGAAAVMWGAYFGELTTIISIGEREAGTMLDSCKKHIEVLKDLGASFLATKRSNANMIEFESGGRIIALPSSGGRSFSGNVILDEYAYQDHATEVWDNAAPVTMLGGNKMRVVSTPNGIGNEFHARWDMATNPDYVSLVPAGIATIKWNPHRIPMNRAIADGYVVDLASCWTMANGDPRLFEQMFNCSFLDNVLQYINGSMIDACLTRDVLTTMVGGEFYAGLDIGREADLTCLVVVRRVRGVAYVVHVETMKRTDGDGMEAMIDRAFDRYKLKRLCIDSTGLGVFPAERIKKKHSERIDVKHRRPRVEPVVFTPTSKELLATGLYTKMMNQLVQLPINDNALPPTVGFDSSIQRKYVVNELGTAKQLRQEIASIQRIISPSGNVMYRTPRTSEGHADRAWALMLALHACSAVNPMIDALRARIAG